MLCYIEHIEKIIMPKGESGRLVIEVDPSLKRRLYSALAMEGSTLKDWFIEAATTFIDEREQPFLPDLERTKKGGERQ
tara:strand:+ start:150 stop:383 length:234 start_codon:yes stop_codon:yes gene_type:complete